MGCERGTREGGERGVKQVREVLRRYVRHTGTEPEQRRVLQLLGVSGNSSRSRRNVRDTGIPTHTHATPSHHISLSLLDAFMHSWKDRRTKALNGGPVCRNRLTGGTTRSLPLASNQPKLSQARLSHQPYPTMTRVPQPTARPSPFWDGCSR